MCSDESIKSKVTRPFEAIKIDYQDFFGGALVWGGLRRRRSTLNRVVGLLVFPLILSACSAHSSISNSTTEATSGSGHKKPSHGVSIGKTIDLAKSPIDALSCVGSGFCMAASNGGTIYRFNGQSWNISIRTTRSQSSGSGISNPTVDCVNAQMCLGELADSNLSVFDGSSWSLPSHIPGAQPIGALGCSPSGSCLAIDAIGDGFLYRNGKWSAAFNAWGSAVSISCVTTDFCAAAGGGVSFWNGSYWTKPVAADPSGLPTAISCLSTKFCMLVDDKGRTLTWNGESFSAAVKVGTDRLNAVSCLTNQWCIAVGNGGEVAVFDGSSWRRILIGSVKSDFTSLSCEAVTSCNLGDSKGQVISVHIGPQQIAQ